MKTLLGFCLILIGIFISGLNPLILWEPSYQIWINEVTRLYPRIFLGVNLFLFFSGSGLIVYDKSRNPAH